MINFADFDCFNNITLRPTNNPENFSIRTSYFHWNNLYQCTDKNKYADEACQIIFHKNFCYSDIYDSNLVMCLFFIENLKF